MHRMRATAKPAVLVHLMVPAAVGPWPWQAGEPASVPCSSAEKQPAAYRDRESARISRYAFAADRAEPPSQFLRPQSYGYSPPAPPDVWPRREHQVPELPAGTFGGPRLAGVGSQ